MVGATLTLVHLQIMGLPVLVESVMVDQGWSNKIICHNFSQLSPLSLTCFNSYLKTL